MAEQNRGASKTRQVNAVGVRRLEVNWQHGSLTVVGTDSGDLVATSSPSTDSEAASGSVSEWFFDVRDNIAILRQHDENALFFEAHQIDITVQVPASVGETDARTAIGNIDVRDLRGKLDLKSGNGDVTVERTDGPIDLKLGLGAIKLREIHGRVDAKSGHGDVSVERFDGSMNLVLGDGNVRIEEVRDSSLELTTGRGNVSIANGSVRSLQVKTGLGEVQCSASLDHGDHDLRTGFGDIAVTIADDSGARMDAATGWGEVESDFPLVRVGRPGPAIFGGQRVVGTIGAVTPISEVKLRTGKGNIRIRRAGGAAPSQTASSTRPAQPTGPSESTGPTTTTPSRAATPDQRLAILEALGRGEISVDEAERRLRES